MLTDEDTMVVYGGNDHVHYENEVCYHYALYAYHIPCNVWTPPAGGFGNISAFWGGAGRALTPLHTH